jgi:hypothetical protein
MGRRASSVDNDLLVMGENSNPQSPIPNSQPPTPISHHLLPITHYAQLTITDTGKGISPEFLPYVFDRFRQEDGSTTRTYGGLGLGLAIVRHIVELHGGTVRAESTGVDQGATFTILLPLMQLKDATPSNSILSPSVLLSPALSLNLDGIRVLLVDDEPDSLAVLSLMLETCGTEVTGTTETGDVGQLLQQFKPDVLVSDIAMPGEDGYSLIRRVRNLSAAEGGQVPAVALSGYARSEDRTQAIQAGYQMHLSKPVQMDELTQAIARLVERHPSTLLRSSIPLPSERV